MRLLSRARRCQPGLDGERHVRIAFGVEPQHLRISRQYCRYVIFLLAEIGADQTRTGLWLNECVQTAGRLNQTMAGGVPGSFRCERQQAVVVPAIAYLES